MTCPNDKSPTNPYQTKLSVKGIGSEADKDESIIRTDRGGRLCGVCGIRNQISLNAVMKKKWYEIIHFGQEKERRFFSFRIVDQEGIA